MQIVQTPAPARQGRGFRALPAAPLSSRASSEAGELQTRDEPIDLADIAAVLEGNPKAVWFRAAGPERQELVGSVTGSRARIALAFGVAPDELLAEVQRRLRNKPEIVEVARAEAPVQEVVLTDDADLTALPVHLQHGADGGPYISSSIDYVIDGRTGWTNVGIRRLMLRGRREAGVDLVSPSDLRALYEASAARGAPLPVSFVVGAHPDRSRGGDHAASCRRARPRRGAARRTAAGGQMRDQRHPRAG